MTGILQRSLTQQAIFSVNLKSQLAQRFPVVIPPNWVVDGSISSPQIEFESSSPHLASKHVETAQQVTSLDQVDTVLSTIELEKDVTPSLEDQKKSEDIDLPVVSEPLHDEPPAAPDDVPSRKQKTSKKKKKKKLVKSNGHAAQSAVSRDDDDDFEVEDLESECCVCYSAS